MPLLGRASLNDMHGLDGFGHARHANDGLLGNLAQFRRGLRVVIFKQFLGHLEDGLGHDGRPVLERNGELPFYLRAVDIF